MITVDQDLLITDVNEQMVRLTEVPKDRLIGSRFDSYFTAPNEAAAGVRKTLADGYVTNYELTLRTPSGRECWCPSMPRSSRTPEAKSAASSPSPAMLPSSGSWRSGSASSRTTAAA